MERHSRQFDKGLEQLKRVRDLGVDAVFTPSDLAMNRGPYFSPRQMKRFIWPYLRRFAAVCQDWGLFSILHTDGEVSSLLPDIAYSGVNAVQAIDPTAGMSLTSAREFAGDKLCLIGNVDCGLLVAGTPEQIYQETLDLIRSAHKQGPFVLGASNAVQVDVPIENYEALVAARRDFQKGISSFQTPS